MSEAYLEKSCEALPSEVLAVLPQQGHLQLELAHGIACHAYLQQVSRLEAEAEQLQSDLVQSHQTVKTLERRLAGMEAELMEHQQRARQSMNEQHKLVAEKNALIETVKRLNREVAKLEHFKRNLLQQLQDDSEADASSSAYAAVDLTTERLVSEVLNSADGIAAAAAAAGPQGGVGSSSGHYAQQHQQQQQQQWQGQQQGSWSPPRQGGAAPGAAGRLQGAGSPSKTYSSMGHAAGHDSSSGAAAGAAGGSPYRGVRSASSAAKEAVLGSKAGIPAAGGSSGSSPPAGGGGRQGGPAGGSGAARGLAAAAAASAMGPRFSSPPHGNAGRSAGAAAGRPGPATSPRIDGKEFFRQARARLSYEQFSQFLLAIKELNAGRSSREDTLAAAKALFGHNNSDLYGLFEGLLMRHLTTF